MDYYKKVLQNQQLLEQFLDQHNLVLNEVIQTNDRAVLFCEEVDVFMSMATDAFLGLKNSALGGLLGIGMLMNGPYRHIGKVLFANVDDFCFVLHDMYCEQRDLSQQWQQFLYEKFGFAYANHLKKTIKEDERKQATKNENSRELPF